MNGTWSVARCWFFHFSNLFSPRMINTFKHYEENLTIMFYSGIASVTCNENTYVFRLHVICLAQRFLIKMNKRGVLMSKRTFFSILNFFGLRHNV